MIIIEGVAISTVTVQLSHGRMLVRDCEECEEADDMMLDIIHKI